MAQSVLIKDTTREEREEIVRRGLSFCGDGSCEQCSGCSMGVGSIGAMYQPYIDGKLELAEVNMLHAATTFTLGRRAKRGRCIHRAASVRIQHRDEQRIVEAPCTHAHPSTLSSRSASSATRTSSSLHHKTMLAAGRGLLPPGRHLRSRRSGERRALSRGPP